MATLVTGRMVEDRTITLNDLTQSSGPLMFRNKIINGNFDIWQRGTSFPSVANGAYTADRWETAYDGSGGTRTISRQPFDLGQTLVPNEPTYFLRWNQSVAGTNATYNVIRQKIESVRSFANKNITVTFYAKAANALTMVVYGFQYFGTGGSPNTFTDNFEILNVTTSWQKFTVNLTVPSLATKTIGSSNDDSLIITFALPLNTTFTFDIAQVQVEEGTAATPFELRPIGTELQLCQRYFEVCGNFILRTSDTNGNWGGMAPFYYKFAVNKRTNTYSLTFYNGDALGGTKNAINRNGTEQLIPSQITFGSTGNVYTAAFLDSLRLHNNTALTLSPGNYITGSIAIDAEL